MKNLPCNIIEDLLPLYIDSVCSDETNELIESHIENCEDCQHKLELMRANLPEAYIEENLEDSKMLNKLSDTWIKNTRVDIKASIITVVFYVFMIGVLFISMWLEEKAGRTFMFEYQFVDFFIKVLSWIAFGGLVAFLGGRPKGSKKTIMLELIVIGIPSLLMTFIFFIYYLIQISFARFVGQNLTEITLIGGLLLGCEVYRLIYGIRQKRR